MYLIKIKMYFIKKERKKESVLYKDLYYCITYYVLLYYVLRIVPSFSLLSSLKKCITNCITLSYRGEMSGY